MWGLQCSVGSFCAPHNTDDGLLVCACCISQDVTWSTHLNFLRCLRNTSLCTTRLGVLITNVELHASVPVVGQLVCNHPNLGVPNRSYTMCCISGRVENEENVAPK